MFLPQDYDPDKDDQKVCFVFITCAIKWSMHIKKQLLAWKKQFIAFSQMRLKKTKRCDRGEINIGHKYASTDMYVLIDVNYVQQFLLNPLPYKNQ